jgi:hypothetical protein
MPNHKPKQDHKEIEFIFDGYMDQLSPVLKHLRDMMKQRGWNLVITTHGPKCEYEFDLRR